MNPIELTFSPGGVFPVAHLPNVGHTYVVGTTVPTDGTAGYAPGCIFSKYNGAAGTVFYLNEGTATSCDFNALANTAWQPPLSLASLTATAAELNYLDSDGSVSNLSVTAGTGITGGTGTIYKQGVIKVGQLFLTTIYIDLTGLDAIATDGDIIGNSTNPAHLGRITAAINGTIESMRVTCEEAPAGASADIDVFRATVATGKLDDAISGVTGQAVAITAGGAWANGTVKCATAVPAANDYLYLCNGAGANSGTYTAGKFRIELLGY